MSKIVKMMKLSRRLRQDGFKEAADRIEVRCIELMESVR